jgi:hypothetical protein
VEYLIGYEGNALAFTGNARDDLLSITSVHPMREDAVAEFLKCAGTGWDNMRVLIKSLNLVVIEYQGKRFYMRRLPALRLPHF